MSPDPAADERQEWPGRRSRGMPWELGVEGRRRAEELLHGHLANIDLDGLWFPLPETTAEEVTSATRDVHAAVLADLYALVEEMRFEIAFGSMIMADFDAAVASGTARPNEPDASNPISQLGMLIEHLAILSHYGAPTPSPVRLFEEPYEHMAGHRVLSTWVAAQLFDSAWYRGISALDRLATLLWTRTEPQIQPNQQYPSFTPSRMRDLRREYETFPAWAELLGVCSDPLLATIRRLRDQFTHRVRMASKLHGAHRTAYLSGRQIEEGEDSDIHESIAVALYDRFLREAARLVRQLFSERFPGRPESVDS
jgi:hypothetical protein